MEILSTWQFWVGLVVAFIVVFIVWIICAASGRGSRMEERMGDDLIYEAGERERMRRGKPDIKIVTQNNPRTD